MRMPSRRTAVVSVLAVLAAGAAVLLLTPARGGVCFERLGGPGPNSNTSRLDTTLDIPADQWPDVARIMGDFGAERRWTVESGPGRDDPAYAWLDMCDTATIVRAGNRNGEGGGIGFGIIHMAYQGPEALAWQPHYRELHRRLEARWPGRMRYVEGEFGERIARPDWVDE